jgi:hypothetical protein
MMCDKNVAGFISHYVSAEVLIAVKNHITVFWVIRIVVQKVGINVSEEHTASICNAEVGTHTTDKRRHDKENHSMTVYCILLMTETHYAF